MNIVCLDLEGVLVPEIWIAFAKASGIPELKRTTRDEPDYDKLMNWRLGILKEHGLGLKEIQETIATIDPIPGAKEFLDELRKTTQVIIISDTFTQFAAPLMEKLGWPTIFCNSLEVAENGEITGFKMRIEQSKLSTVKALQSIGFDTIASGDSYNDLGMIRAGKAGFLFRSHTFVQICDDVSFYLKFTGIEGHTACCLRPDTNGVIHIIIGKSAFLDLFHGEVTGQLVNDGGNHFQMSKLFSSDIRQQSCHFLKGHGITLGQITHAGTHFPVGATVLGDDDLGQFGIGFLDIYREL